MKPSRERIDFSVYLRAFGVYARNPTVIVLPLLAYVVGVFAGQLGYGSGDGLLGGIMSFLLQLLQLFALGVAVIIADAGWRRGKASFDDAWQDARHKGRDILFAAFGFVFVLSIAQYVGQFVGSMIGGSATLIIFVAIACYGLIYTIPAASIGGIPGGASIGVSIERVKSAPLAAGILTAVSLVLVFYVGLFIDQWVIDGLNIASPLVASLIAVLVRSVLTGYVAIVMAKVYTDVSFTMPRW